MSRLVLLALIIGPLTGCGGEPSAFSPDGDIGSQYPGGCVPGECTPVVKAFEGEWEGDAAIFTSDASETTYSTVIRVSIFSGHPQSASIRGVCVDGSGYFVAGATVGDGGRLAWVGTISCPLTTPDCPDRVAAIEWATLALVGEGAVVMMLSGRTLGCGQSNRINGLFVGTRSYSD